MNPIRVMPVQKSVNSLKSLSMTYVFEHLDARADQWAQQHQQVLVMEEQRMLTSFELLRKLLIVFNAFIYINAACKNNLNVIFYLLILTATQILASIFHMASARPRIKTEHLKLLISRQFKAISLSQLFENDNAVIQLLCFISSSTQESVGCYMSLIITLKPL